MKKRELFFGLMLSILLLVSFTNVSVAAPPSYVGVKNGDEFIWTASLNVVNLNSTGSLLFGAAEWTYMYEYFLDYFKNTTHMDFDFLAGAGMKAVMVNVSDVIPHPYLPFSGSGLYFDFYTASAANNWTLRSAAANMTYPMIFLIDPSSLNESTVLNVFSGTPLIMPVGFNYTMLAKGFQTMIATIPRLDGNMTVEVLGNGLKITMKQLYIEWMVNITMGPTELGTLSDVVMTARWNSIGVFDYGSVAYGGLTLATAQLMPTDEGLIPGYEIVTILGISIVTIIAIIYIKRKKNI